MKILIKCPWARCRSFTRPRGAAEPDLRLCMRREAIFWSYHKSSESQEHLDQQHIGEVCQLSVVLCVNCKHDCRQLQHSMSLSSERQMHLSMPSIFQHLAEWHKATRCFPGHCCHADPLPSHGPLVLSDDQWPAPLRTHRRHESQWRAKVGRENTRPARHRTQRTRPLFGGLEQNSFSGSARQPVCCAGGKPASVHL